VKLIFLHGPPASGKYTIAQELRRSYGVLSFHNHLTIDVAKALFDFGTPEFWQLVHQLRRVALAAKADDGEASVVFTSSYSCPHDDAEVSELEHLVTAGGGEFVPVYLECDVNELRHRVSETSRQGMRKLQTAQGLDEFLTTWNCVALARPNCRTVVTTGRGPAECATEIAQGLELPAGR
jgi:hypothetical protein